VLIILLNTSCNFFFSNILFELIKPHAERITGIYQRGFRTGRSISDQIHALTQILEKTAEFNISTFIYLFVLNQLMIALKEMHSKIIIVNTVQCDSIRIYLLPLHVSVS
jgi:hypothetical protein